MSVSDRYLKRLGVERPTVFDLPTLQSLLEAHLRNIPFEDVTSFLGYPVSLNPDECFNKLLEGGRGGYCMEHALLSRTALSELGFKVDAQMARVFFGPDTDRPTAQTHAVNLVHIDGKSYIYDPGFGGYTPSIPILVNDNDAVQVGPYNTYRLRLAPSTVGDTIAPTKMAEDVTHVLEQQLGDKWVALYGLTRPPVIPEDVVAFNWFVSTSPLSFFTRKLMCSAWDGDNRVTGFSRNFRKRTAGGGVADAVLNSRDDVDHWLRVEMRLNLTDGQVEAIWNKLQHEEPL